MPHISRGNHKLGRVANVSMTPALTCSLNVPCKRKCYACNIERRNVIPALQWKENAILAMKAPEAYFGYIEAYLKQFPTPWFRWHVGGDIINAGYLKRMREIARAFPGTGFLCFTKRHELNYRNLPLNLTVVLSMWPRWGNTRKKMPRAWVQDGSETRIPRDAIACANKCTDCKSCWHLPELNKDVWFKLHR